MKKLMFVKRNKEIVKIRFLKNEKTGRNHHTLKEIGDKYNITRGRVRQIIVKQNGNTGNFKEFITKICKYCHTNFEVSVKSKQFLCSPKCRRYYLSKIPGHPMSEYSEVEMRKYNKKRNDRTKEYRKLYYQKNRKRILKYKHQKTNV